MGNSAGFRETESLHDVKSWEHRRHKHRAEVRTDRAPRRTSVCSGCAAVMR